MLLQLQKFDIHVTYHPGKEMKIADALSRDFINDSGTNRDHNEDMIFEIFEDINSSTE